ncbi:hypothetical protein EJB05_15069, partial [Eragrostis curvula]
MLRDVREAAAADGGKVVKLRDHLLMVSLNVVSRLVLGKKYVTDDDDKRPGSKMTTPEEFRWMIHEVFVLMGALNVGDLIPWLGWLDLQGYVGRMKRLHKMFDRFLEHVVMLQASCGGELEEK